MRIAGLLFACLVAGSLAQAQQFLAWDDLAVHVQVAPGRARQILYGHARMAVERPLEVTFALVNKENKRMWLSERQANLLQALAIAGDNWRTGFELDKNLSLITAQRIDDTPLVVPTEVKDWEARIEGLNRAITQGLGRPLILRREQSESGVVEFKLARFDTVYQFGDPSSTGQPLFKIFETGDHFIYRGFSFRITRKEYTLIKLFSDSPLRVFSLDELRQRLGFNSRSIIPRSMIKELNLKTFKRTGAKLFRRSDNFYSMRLIKFPIFHPELKPVTIREREVWLSGRSLYLFELFKLADGEWPVQVKISYAQWERLVRMPVRDFLHDAQVLNAKLRAAFKTHAIEEIMIEEDRDFVRYRWTRGHFDMDWRDIPESTCRRVLLE